MQNRLNSGLNSTFRLRYFYPKNLLLVSLFASCISSSLWAEDYSIRVGYGRADSNSLVNIVTGDWQAYSGHTSVVNVDGGWRFVHNAFETPFDFYLKGGLSHFNENGLQDNFLEATFYLKVYGKLDFLGNRVRAGLGEGVSYAGDIPMSEIDDAKKTDGSSGPTSQLLNYLDISFDIDVGRLIGVKSLNNLYLGYTLKHRSGIYGFYYGVEGGSNYNMLTLEKNF